MNILLTSKNLKSKMKSNLKLLCFQSQIYKFSTYGFHLSNKSI